MPVEKRVSSGGVSGRGGRRNSRVGGAPVSSSSSCSELQAAINAKTADFLGKPRKRRRNRKKLKYVKSGTKVVVRRWSDDEEYGPFDVITAGQHFIRVRNPVSGESGRVCRKRYGIFDWRPPRDSRSVSDLESGEGYRCQSTTRDGAWSCPSLVCGSARGVPIRPWCCRSVCDARFDPGPWFGPTIGRHDVASRHLCDFRRSS